MIKNSLLVDKLNNIINSQESLSFEKKLSIFNEMYLYAKSLGHFPSQNPLEGIEVDIKRSKILNGLHKAN